MWRDKMQRQRFEFKYLVDEDTALAIRDFVASYLNLDEAGVGRPNYAYRVNSTYLDSPELTTFWDWVNSNRNRFKLRMRFYDSEPNTPVFLEIKRRVSACILKQRCGIRKSATETILQGMVPPEDQIVSREPRQLVALQNFVNLVAQLNAGPTALVTYLREAYIDPDNEGVRLTLDREVRIALRQKEDYSLNMPHYVQPFGEMIILELKFNNRFPDWFGDLVRSFGLTRGAAAKYCEGIAAFYKPELGNRGASAKKIRRIGLATGHSIAGAVTGPKPSLA